MSPIWSPDPHARHREVAKAGVYQLLQTVVFGVRRSFPVVPEGNETLVKIATIRVWSMMKASEEYIDYATQAPSS